MCKINGRMVTVNELKNFMSKFIEIHGQNDNQSLLDNKFHLKYLDGFIGEELLKYKQEYKENYTRYIEIKQELKANYGDEKERERKLDLLKYQFNEIEEAELKEKEEEELEEKRKIMLNSEKISNSLNEADAAKISRIVDKYELATIDTEAMRKAALAKQPDEFKDVKPLTEKEHDELVSSLLDSMKEEQNPSMARTKTRGENQFEHISMEEGINKRPSVKKELDEIKNRNKKAFWEAFKY